MFAGLVAAAQAAHKWLTTLRQPVPDTENLKPQIAAYLKSIAKDDDKLKLLSAASVAVNLRTVLLSS